MKYRSTEKCNGWAVEERVNGRWQRLHLYKHRSNATERIRRLRTQQGRDDIANIGQQLISSPKFCVVRLPR